MTSSCLHLDIDISISIYLYVCMREGVQREYTSIHLEILVQKIEIEKEEKERESCGGKEASLLHIWN